MTMTTPRKPAGTAKRAARKPRVADVPVAEAPEPVAEASEHEEVEVEAEIDAPVEGVAEQRAKYIAKRKLTFKGVEYAAGDPVPGAEEIQRIETWVIHGYLKEA